jgi:hypothetical protein
MNYNNKIIISLPLLATILAAAAASTITTVAYGQDWLIGSPDAPALNSTQSESEADRLHEQRLQQRLQEKGMQDQRPGAVAPPPVTAQNTTTTTTTSLAQDPDFVRFAEVGEQCLNSATFGSSGATMTQEQCTQFFEQSQEKWCGLAAYDAQKCEHTSRITAAWNNLVNLSEAYGFSDIPSLGELGIDPRTIAPPSSSP